MLNLPYIKSRREALDLSLADAARLAGWGEKARGHWYDIESGRAPNPTLKTLLDMCRVLECDISQLVNTSPSAFSFRFSHLHSHLGQAVGGNLLLVFYRLGWPHAISQ